MINDNYYYITITDNAVAALPCSHAPRRVATMTDLTADFDFFGENRLK